MVQAELVDRAAALGLHSRPGNREAISGDAELCHELDVGLEAVVVVTGNVAVVIVVHTAGNVAETVPDRRTLPVVMGGPFDLVCGRRDSPEKTFGKGELTAHRSSPPRIVTRP